MPDEYPGASGSLLDRQDTVQKAVAATFDATDLLDDAARPIAGEIIRRFQSGAFQMYFSTVLTELAKKGISQHRIAEVLDVSDAAVSKWNNGVSSIRADKFHALFVHFRQELEGFVGPPLKDRIVAGFVNAIQFIKKSTIERGLGGLGNLTTGLYPWEWELLRRTMRAGAAKIEPVSGLKVNWIFDHKSLEIVRRFDPSIAPRVGPDDVHCAEYERILRTWADCYLLLDYVMASLYPPYGGKNNG